MPAEASVMLTESYAHTSDSRGTGTTSTSTSTGTTASSTTSTGTTTTGTGTGMSVGTRSLDTSIQLGVLHAIIHWANPPRTDADKEALGGKRKKPAVSLVRLV
jgi:hypothetical protein